LIRRLDDEFIVFRGEEHEASGQLLKGVLVLCLKEPLKVEDVHLRLTGQCRISFLDSTNTPSGIYNKLDRTTVLLKHNWPPFVANHTTLPAGNYEWPFELMLPGDTAESVEGLYQTGISYLFKATVCRGKLFKNLHAYKRLRIIRTLAPAAMDLNHAMSVENIWPNKVEYSINIPQKAVVFGSSVPFQMRFSPLLKGLEMGRITIRLMELQELTMTRIYPGTRMHKYDKEVMSWHFDVDRENHWHDLIEETGQEGWVIKREIQLPKKLNMCIQDCLVHGIKIRHRFKLSVSLHNPTGHISEVCVGSHAFQCRSPC